MYVRKETLGISIHRCGDSGKLFADGRVCEKAEIVGLRPRYVSRGGTVMATAPVIGRPANRTSHGILGDIKLIELADYVKNLRGDGSSRRVVLIITDSDVVNLAMARRIIEELSGYRKLITSHPPIYARALSNYTKWVLR